MERILKISVVLMILCLGVVYMNLLNGCSVKSDDSNPYSRENTVGAFWQGYGADDQELITCQFVYGNKSFSEIYGNDFEIKDVLCTSDMESGLGMLNGTGECTVYIEDDIWCVNVTKNNFEKWKVKDYFKCAIDPQDGDVLLDDSGNIVKAE